MSKNFFISTAMMATISEGVNIRERAHDTMDNLITEQMFAQISHEHDPPTDVRYYGPQDHNPSQSDIYTPFTTPWELGGSSSTDETTMAQVTYDTRKGDTQGGVEVPDPLPERGGFAQTAAERPFYEEFAQESESRRCSIAMLRNWNTTDDYSQIRT